MGPAQHDHHLPGGGGIRGFVFDHQKPSAVSRDVISWMKSPPAAQSDCASGMPCKNRPESEQNAVELQRCYAVLRLRNRRATSWEQAKAARP